MSRSKAQSKRNDLKQASKTRLKIGIKMYLLPLLNAGVFLQPQDALATLKANGIKCTMTRMMRYVGLYLDTQTPIATK